VAKDNRCQPDGVDAEFLQVIETARDPVQIADSVTIGVLEAPRVDLVDDRVFPPPLGSTLIRSRRLRVGRPSAQREGEEKYREILKD
jgi:hypothetical protein